MLSNSLPIYKSMMKDFVAMPFDSPLKDASSKFMPKNLWEAFDFCEFMFANSPQIASNLTRFSSYPITDVHLKSSSKLAEDAIRSWFNDTLYIREYLLYIGLNLYVYGNIFVSMRYPFTRSLVCKKCGKKNRLSYRTKSSKIKGFKSGTIDVLMECDKCKAVTPHVIKDRKHVAIEKLKPVVWNPKDIRIKYIDIAGENVYYAHMNKTTRKLIKECDIDMLREVPKDLIKCAIKGKTFKFQKGELLHLKLNGLVGSNPSWGYPLFLSALRQFFFVFALRSANQSIAMEHLTHHRILFPSQADASGSLIKAIGGETWKNEVYKLVLGKRLDPNFVGVSPVPLGQIDLGGNGKMLLTDAEIKNAETNMNLAFGFPVEFLQGNLATNASVISLNVLERELMKYVGNLNRMLRWLADHFTRYNDLETVEEVSLVEFKLKDDIALQQNLMMARQQGELSQSTFNKLTGMNIDMEVEREKMMNEQVEQHKYQSKLQKKIEELENSLNDKIEAAMNSNPAQNGFNKEEYWAIANQQAEELFQMDQNERQSRMIQIEKDDEMLGALVRQLYQRLKEQHKA